MTLPFLFCSKWNNVVSSKRLIESLKKVAEYVYKEVIEDYYKSFCIL